MSVGQKRTTTALSSRESIVGVHDNISTCGCNHITFESTTIRHLQGLNTDIRFPGLGAKNKKVKRMKS